MAHVYVYIDLNEQKACNSVRRGEMTRLQAAKKFKISPVILNKLCTMQGIHATVGRPRKVKK